MLGLFGTIALAAVPPVLAAAFLRAYVPNWFTLQRAVLLGMVWLGLEALTFNALPFTPWYGAGFGPVINLALLLAALLYSRERLALYMRFSMLRRFPSVTHHPTSPFVDELAVAIAKAYPRTKVRIVWSPSVADQVNIVVKERIVMVFTFGGNGAAWLYLWIEHKPVQPRHGCVARS